MAVLFIPVAIAYFRYHQQCDRAKEVFGKIHPGITKAEVKAIAGEPTFVDTSGLQYDIWIFDVPAIFADRPHCFFQKGDSILVRFMWEPIDTALQ